MSLLPENELQAVEAWFSDLKDALGISQNADRGRVLASVKKLVTDNESYDQEKRVVAVALKYKRWGDLYTWASQQLLATPEVELPEVFSVPPNGWVFRPGGDYDKAQKRLVKTRLRVKELWAYLDQEVAADLGNREWAENIKVQAIEEFMASKEAEEFDRTCLAFVRNYEEEDPGAAWVPVTDEATATLERDFYLPVGVVTELICYAENAGVETTKRELELARDRLNPAGYWFDYLLTAYLYENNRPEKEQVWSIGELFLEATGLWECYEEVSGNDPEKPGFTKRSYDPTLTLAQVVTALKKLVELKKSRPDGTRDEFAVEVKEAIAALKEEKGLAISA